MSKVEGGDTITMEFTYNHAGLRTKKVKKVNGVVKETTEYILNGKNVVELIHTNHVTNTVNKLHFYYDAQGRVALVDFNGVLYSYAHNLQGDIIGILDTNGNLVVEYRYDAWGKPVSTIGTLTTTLGVLNPFRYRGYVWDHEIGCYYLQDRYYNIDLIRFFNIDSYTSYVLNAFLYCGNSPVLNIDDDGCIWIGCIHSKVQKHIVDNNPGISKELWLGTDKMICRVDLYRKSTNEYWEIKPMSCNDIDKLTYSINLAGKQLSKYYNMHIYREKDNEHAICARPGEAISPGTFKYECYLVSYASYELGVIIYAYDIISSPIPQKAKEKEPSRSLLNRGPAVDYIYDYADEASARKYIPLLLAGGGLVFLVLSLDELLNNPMRN